MTDGRANSEFGAPRWLLVIFAASGFAALLYQIVWQRALFSIYGINVESVTVVVTAFMLGLGLGSFLGGKLSRRRPAALLGSFSAIEAAIGAFGAVSLQLFHEVGERTLAWPAAAVAAVTFALVLLPTVLMGATLPLLVAWAVPRSGNVGRSVGALYFVNTLGSALASFAAGFVCLRYLGQQGTVYAAVVLNVGASAAVYARGRREVAR